MELFPKGNERLSPESIGERLTFYKEQLQLYHWQTNSYAEHKALDGLISSITSFRDEIIEKIMGYNGRRIGVYKIAPFQPYKEGASMATVGELLKFAVELKKYSTEYSMPDINNLADSLSGEAAKTKYLLTLT